ncbi:MAG TPA: acylphosphatase [Stellaceae bacterium]|nr:acylphosphatase [Stellaceae bacterium]
MRAVRLTVTGRVQGVGYRIWAERQAAALSLRGWVRNRADGSVEILAIGADHAIAALSEACRQGPRAAIVTDVAIADAEDDGSVGFAARPTL